ncbi:MAG TPA: 2OG-Fe(II) oxygenase [Marinagarivorans sp.]
MTNSRLFELTAPSVVEGSNKLVADDAANHRAIAHDLYRDGYSIRHNALSPGLLELLVQTLNALSNNDFEAAGIGRAQDHTLDEQVRSDKIRWITGESAAGQAWLAWAEALKVEINRRLFLGLFSFESHFAHYAPGDFYQRHSDAFRGQANRTLSVVVYLNEQWREHEGGELVLYRDEADPTGIKVLPEWGTVVAFLSEEFPHEVLPAVRDRYSIAGWFRINTSSSTRVDPPA